MNFGYEGKAVVITGSSKGIGRETAEQMVKLGAKVMLVARGSDTLEKAKADISQYGEVDCIQADVTEEGASEKVINYTIDKFGRLDVLINNAGGSFAEPFESLEVSDWQQDIDLKLMPAVKMSRTALPHLKQNGGAILNLTAVLAKTPPASSLPT